MPTRFCRRSPARLNLAAAGGLDLAHAADLATNVMSAFKLSVGDLTDINDLLAQGAASSNTSVGELGEAIKAVGPVAAELGIPIKEIVELLGAMANNGIKGQEAGTALKTSLGRLVDVTPKAAAAFAKLDLSVKDFQDSQGNLDLQGLLKAMRAAGAGTEEFVKVFGKQHFGKILAASGDELDKVIDKLAETEGAAKRMAEIRMEGLPGQMKRLTSAMEGAALAIAKSGLIDRISDMAIAGADLLSSIATTNPELLNMGVKVAVVAAAVGPAVIVLGAMMRAVSGVAVAMRGLALIMAANPILLVGTLAIAAAAGLAILSDEHKASNQFARQHKDAISELKTELYGATDATEALTAAQKSARQVDLSLQLNDQVAQLEKIQKESQRQAFLARDRLGGGGLFGLGGLGSGDVVDALESVGQYDSLIATFQGVEDGTVGAVEAIKRLQKAFVDMQEAGTDSDVLQEFAEKVGLKDSTPDEVDNLVDQLEVMEVAAREIERLQAEIAALSGTDNGAASGKDIAAVKGSDSKAQNAVDSVRGDSSAKIAAAQAQLEAAHRQMQENLRGVNTLPSVHLGEVPDEANLNKQIAASQAATGKQQVEAVVTGPVTAEIEGKASVDVNITVKGDASTSVGSSDSGDIAVDVGVNNINGE